MKFLSFTVKPEHVNFSSLCSTCISLGSKTRNVFPDTKGKCFCWHERQMFLQPWKEEEKKTCTWQKVYGKRKREICKKGKNSQTSASYRGRKIRPWEPVCLKRNERIMWEAILWQILLYIFSVCGVKNQENTSQSWQKKLGFCLPRYVTQGSQQNKTATEVSLWHRKVSTCTISLEYVFSNGGQILRDFGAKKY